MNNVVKLKSKHRQDLMNEPNVPKWNELTAITSLSMSQMLRIRNEYIALLDNLGTLEGQINQNLASHSDNKVGPKA